ncbi:hypothetical protein [Zhihengliuella flava]|uniref:DUF4287 domain-containing protein n=1 Tax=Zhihengliuella flava TaxID=1285193 RepID=A0A931D4N0_9MICC|nr:hypothetical protein [Zhihengliuella flava]MBG6084344.1 hypothetical protein [Zhihengliuella flava]
MANTTKASNTPAIEKATHRAWDDWVSLLSAAGAGDLPHPQIAELAVAQMPAELKNPGWWAQAVAIAFEQHVGRRVPGQKADGTFAASASKTRAGSRREALSALAEAVTRADAAGGLGGVALDGAARQSETDKWCYWRADFADGTRASISISEASGKAKISVEHGPTGPPRRGRALESRVEGPAGAALGLRDLLGISPRFAIKFNERT